MDVKSSLHEQARQRDNGPRKRPFQFGGAKQAIARFQTSKQKTPASRDRSRKHLLPEVEASSRLLIGGAGWSSPVARQAHNLKVTGSNPVPATKSKQPGSPRAVLVSG